MHWEQLLLGFMTLLDPVNLIWLLFGLFAGILLAAIPGIGAELGIVLLIPITFASPPEAVFLMITAMYCGGMFGGAISSILLRIPGHPSAAATAIDGYALAQKGEAGKALGMAVLSSSVGGLFGVFALIFLSTQLAAVAVRFTSAEFFALAVLGLTLVASVSGKSMGKALLAVCIGLLIPITGIDPITGSTRMTFGFSRLIDGFHFAPVLIGVFAIAEVFRKSAQKVDVQIIQKKVKAVWPDLKEINEVKYTILRSSVIGTIIGILPAVGGTIASFISYGVAAPEAANNAAAGGSLVPLLALGIPGSAVTAIILGAFILHGLQPGPMLFVEQSQFVYTIFAGLLFANITMLLLGRFTSNIFARVIDIPYSILMPFILILSVIGSYSIRNSFSDVWIMFVFGIVGYVMVRYEFPVMPLVLGVILGPIAEISFRRALIISHGSVIGLLTRPITMTLLIIAILSIVIPIIRSLIKRRKETQASDQNTREI